MTHDERSEETDEGRAGEPSDRAGDSGLARLAEQRGISEKVLSAAGIRVCTGGQFGGWWGIPYPHRTGTHKLRYNNPNPKSQPKYMDDSGAIFHLYNPGLLGPGEDEIWFCEGEYDTLTLIDQGLKAIGIHGVSNVEIEEDDTKPQRGFRKSWKLLFEDTLCITMFDNDDAGKKAGREIARKLDGHTFDGWNDEYDDANSWHRADPDGLADAISRFRYRFHRSGRF